MRYRAWIALAGLCVSATSFAAAAASSPPPRADRPFADVPRDHWAYEAVEELRKRGILRGYPPAPARPPVEKKAPATGKGRPEKPATPRR